MHLANGRGLGSGTVMERAHGDDSLLGAQGAPMSFARGASTTRG